MKKVIKFISLSFLLLFARGCDIYSTSLWYFDNPSHETNPFSSVLGLGWNGLIMSNLLIVGLIIYAFYYYTYNYSIQLPRVEFKKLTEFVSLYYFNEKGKFYQVFYRMPKNKRILIAHTGYVLIRVGIIGSFLAAFHNLSLFYNLSIYDDYSRFVGWPEYVVYGLVISCIILFTIKIWKNEFEFAKEFSLKTNIKNDI